MDESMEKVIDFVFDRMIGDLQTEINASQSFLDELTYDGFSKNFHTGRMDAYSKAINLVLSSRESLKRLLNYT